MSDTELYRRLDEAARSYPVGIEVVGAAARAGRRHRLVYRLATTVTCLCVVAAAVFAGAGGWDRLHEARSSPVAGSTQDGLLSWPTRGAEAGNGNLITSATQRWDAAGSAHTQVRALFAGEVAGAPFVLIEGLDQASAARIAIVSGGVTGTSQPPRSGQLFLRLDAAAPVAAVSTIGFASAHLGSGEGAPTPGGVFTVFALARPGVSDVVVGSSTVDDAMTENAGHRGRDSDWMTLFRASAAFTDYVTVYTGDRADGERVPIRYTGIGDLDSMPVRVTGRTDSTLMLAGGAEIGVKVGQWIVADGALVGRVTAVTQGAGTAQRIDAPEFQSPVHVDVTGTPAQARGAGAGTLRATPTDAAGERILPGNRLMLNLSLPADAPIPVTVGHVISVADDGSVLVRSEVNLGSVGQVSALN